MVSHGDTITRMRDVPWETPSFCLAITLTWTKLVVKGGVISSIASFLLSLHQALQQDKRHVCLWRDNSTGQS